MKELGVFVFLFALSTAGCKDKNVAKGTETTGAAASIQSPKAPPDVSVDDFVAKIAPAVCHTVDQCKNEKVAAVLTAMPMMVATFGAVDSPDLLRQMAPVEATMKVEKRWLPTEAECKTAGSVALQSVGMKSAFLKANVGKTLSYDGKKAAACLASLEAPPDACKQTLKLAAGPKVAEVAGFQRELKEPLEAYVKPCEKVVSGLVEADKACEYDLQCKGDLKCRPGKKDPKAQTCQPK